MKNSRQNFRHVDPIREATIATLQRIVDHLVILMFDSGVTVQELSHLIKDRAVRIATNRIARELGRNNNSRVAIVTGLSRFEVRKILETAHAIPSQPNSESAARRVLGGWFDDPRFLSKSGDPAVLPIFGRGRSFERLVSLYAAGLPVRAMLDELVKIDAIECCERQIVRAKSRVPILKGITTNAVTAIGERCSDLLQTLTHNLRVSSTPLFVATAQTSEAEAEAVPFLRREIAAQGTSLINAANALMKGSMRNPANRPAQHRTKCKLGVSVYYFEHANDVEESTGAIADQRRKNLRRLPARQGGRTHLNRRK